MRVFLNLCLRRGEGTPALRDKLIRTQKYEKELTFTGQLSFLPFYQVLWSETWNFFRLPIFWARMSIALQTSSMVTPHSFIITIMW